MEDPIEFQDTVSYKLAKVTTAFRNAIERHMANINLHAGQVLLLFELWEEDGLRQIDLSKRLDVKPPTVNKIIKNLKEINLVVVRKSADDKRDRRVYLTKQGYDIKKKVGDQWIELESEYLHGLTDIDQAILPKLLDKLRTAYTGRETSPEEE